MIEMCPEIWQYRFHCWSCPLRRICHLQCMHCYPASLRTSVCVDDMTALYKFLAWLYNVLLFSSFTDIMVTLKEFTIDINTKQ